MKKRTLLAALLVVPMGAALAQQNEAKLGEESQIYGGMSRKYDVSQEGYKAKWGATGMSVSRDIGSDITSNIGRAQSAAQSNAKFGTYNVPRSNETYPGISNDSMLGRLINWLQQYFGAQGQATKTYQEQTLMNAQGGTTTYNRPSSSNETGSTFNDSTLAQIVRWLQQQLVGVQGEPSQPTIVNQPAR